MRPDSLTFMHSTRVGTGWWYTSGRCAHVLHPFIPNLLDRIVARVYVCVCASISSEYSCAAHRINLLIEAVVAVALCTLSAHENSSLSLRAVHWFHFTHGFTWRQNERISWMQNKWCNSIDYAILIKDANDAINYRPTAFNSTILNIQTFRVHLNWMQSTSQTKRTTRCIAVVYYLSSYCLSTLYKLYGIELSQCSLCIR